MNTGCILGLDGGGTKTEAILLTGDRQEIARATSGPSNYHAVGPDIAQASLQHAIQQVLDSANLTLTDVTAIGLGMAGAARPDDQELVRAIVQRVLSNLTARHAQSAASAAPLPRLWVTHDAECALVGGTGRRYGVVLVAGTGAMAYGVNSQGQSRRADGWGYRMGDEGSAYWIGQQGLRAVACASDGRGPATRLTELLLSHLSLPNTDALVSLVYSDEFGVPQMAELAPLVSQAAQNGDAVAQGISQEAGQRLSHTAQAVIRGLGMADEAFEVVLTGGVLHPQGQVWDVVVAALARIAPRAHVIAPRHNPAFGAALLAQQAGEQSDEKRT